MKLGDMVSEQTCDFPHPSLNAMCNRLMERAP